MTDNEIMDKLQKAIAVIDEIKQQSNNLDFKEALAKSYDYAIDALSILLRK